MDYSGPDKLKSNEKVSFVNISSLRGYLEVILMRFIRSPAPQENI
jgi:hypothetical protein